MRTADFDYDLPSDLIAQQPVEPRHSSRLLDCRDLTDHRFSDLPGLLRAGDLLVVNRTRVRRARLLGTRSDTGGSVELLLLGGEGSRWTALARPARRLRAGVAIEVGSLRAEIVGEPEAGVVTLELRAVGSTVAEAIEAEGLVPLPPYFHGELDDPERYQTIFATETASSAAPTAGLHFTPELMSELDDAGIGLARVHLEVGLDTFRPISSENIEDHVMHSERIEVGAEVAKSIATVRRDGGRVIAVGTTVARSLESAADGADGVVPTAGSTDLFISPGYRFEVIDGLVTNFHAPRSTLVVMIAAFMGDTWRDAYETAVARRYRMLSFGDAMIAFR